MSQSTLIDYEAYTTTNCNVPRNMPISKITVHHAAGVMSVEGMANIIHNPSREVSCQYAIGYDARVGAYIKEENRAWTSSSPWNDNRAVTIEVSNSACSSDWPVSDKVWNKLVLLCTDICKRNNIPSLTFTGDKNGTLTFHCMFTATGCPGPYIKSRAKLLCDQVNAKLNNTTEPTVEATDPKTTTTVESPVAVGDLVSITADAVYWSNTSIPNWVKNTNWYVCDIKNNRAILGKSEDGSCNIQSPIDVRYLAIVRSEATKTKEFQTYVKSCPTPTNVYKSPDELTIVDTIQGAFTIVEEREIDDTTLGKLKSGIGWITVKGVEPVSIKKGDKVKVITPEVYGSTKRFNVYEDFYYVLQVKDDRVVISADNKNVTAAINIKNIRKV